MAYDRSQDSFIKMEIEGEGIYASTVSSDTRGPTDQGLTLSPKIQLNDPWLFDAADSFQDQDLDALLGPVNFDLIAEEAQKRNYGADFLIDSEYQPYEPPAKRRKFTRALSAAPYVPLELNGPDCQSETVSAPPRPRNVSDVCQPSLSSSESTRAPSPLYPAVVGQQQDHPISEETHVSQAFCLPHPIVHPTLPKSTSPSLPAASTSQASASNSVFPSLVLPAAPTEDQHSDRLIPSTGQPNPEVGFQDEKEFIQSSRDKEVETHILDCVDDDGSLFGDDLSNQEPSADCFPIDQGACAELDAELEAELEAQLDAEVEADFRSTQSTFTPHVLPEPRPPAFNSSSTASSAVLDTGFYSFDSSWTSSAYVEVQPRGNPFLTARPLDLDIGPNVYEPPKTPALPALFEADSLAPYNPTAPPMYWDPNMPIPSVEKGSPCGTKNANRMSHHSRKTSIRPPSLKARLSDLEKKLIRLSSRRSPQKLLAQLPGSASVSEQAEARTNKSPVSRCSPAPLPYLLALSLASGESKEAIKNSYRMLQDRKPQKQPSDKSQPPSSAQVPPQLCALLDSLHAKFAYDLHFRNSALMWALDKASYQESHCCDSACELTQMKEELGRVTAERDRYRTLAEEMKDVARELL